MITAFRRYLETWVVRAFFMVMVLAFVLWGVGDVVRLVGTSTWVAKVDGQTIEGQVFQSEYQRAMSAASRNLASGQEPDAAMKQQVGQETLQRMVTQAAMVAELHDLRIVTPDPALATSVRAMPEFQASDGKFSRPQFEAALRNAGLSEGRFMDMMRNQLAQRQLLSAIAAGVGVPQQGLDPIFAAEFERRSADMAEFPINAAAQPAAPDEPVLQRWYDNHPDLYATPEFRKVKVIELTPQALEKEVTASDDELQAYFRQHRSDYITTAKRSVDVISAQDEAKAKALADQWKGGADWAAMQKAAEADGASAISMSDSTEQQFPDPELGKAVFAAPANEVSGPVKGALAWFVVKVTAATAGSETTFEQAKDAVRQRVLADKAADLMYDRANKVDNQLGNGTPFDQLPNDLGLVAVSGTLDSNGNTPNGDPAPIPGPPELRAAIIAAAFQTQKGDLPRLTEVRTSTLGGSAYYALAVDDVTPPGKKPFDAVKQQVEGDWAQDQQRHAQETAAAAMLTAIQKGQSFSDAATVAGVTPHVTPAVTRSENAAGAMPPELQRVLFSLKPGEPTMVETPEAFVVAVPAEIIKPDPKAKTADYDRTRQALNRTVATDIATVFTEAVRERANPRINQANVNQIIQP